MNPYLPIDPYNLQFDHHALHNPAGFVPTSFPLDLTPLTATPNITDLFENNVIPDIPLSQAPLYSSPLPHSPTMTDSQQTQMLIMLMQEQQQQALLQKQQEMDYSHQKRPYFPQESAMAYQQTPRWFLKQQQQEKIRREKSIPAFPSPSYSTSSSPRHHSPLLNQASPQVDMAASSVEETSSILTKQIELVLSINQTIIALLIEHQRMIPNQIREPDLTLYQHRLQSNLTYLATMADISMTGESPKIPTPPDLSPLPAPYTPTAQKIHTLLAYACQLFPATRPPFVEEPEMSPHPQQQRAIQMQQMMMRQQRHVNALPQYAPNSVDYLRDPLPGMAFTNNDLMTMYKNDQHLPY